MKVPRELVVIVSALLAMALATYLIQPTPPAERQAGLSSHSGAPDGTLGLYLWLASLGYRVDRLEYRDFRLDESGSTLLMLAPSVPASADDLAALRRWVEQGGRLILALDGGDGEVSPLSIFGGAERAQRGLLRQFGLELRSLPQPLAEASPPRPLGAPTPGGKVTVSSRSYVAGKSPLLPYLGRSTEPVAVASQTGKGVVYVLASTHAWSNAGLREADNAALLLQWLPPPSEAGGIVFDEIHHGLAAQKSLLNLMVHEPWGWAVFYSLAILFVWLACRGRRFGRAIPLVVDTRRPAAEYAISLAGLLRRGDKRQWVARHYERALRRQLADSFAIDASLAPEEARQTLMRLGPLARRVDPALVEHALARLGSSGSLSERELVSLAAKVGEVIKVCRGR